MLLPVAYDHKPVQGGPGPPRGSGQIVRSALGSLPLLLVSTTLVNLAWLLVFPAQAWVLRLMRTEESGGEP